MGMRSGRAIPICTGASFGSLSNKRSAPCFCCHLDEASESFRRSIKRGTAYGDGGISKIASNIYYDDDDDSNNNKNN